MYIPLHVTWHCCTVFHTYMYIYGALCGNTWLAGWQSLTEIIRMYMYMHARVLYRGGTPGYPPWYIPPLKFDNYCTLNINIYEYSFTSREPLPNKTQQQNQRKAKQTRKATNLSSLNCLCQVVQTFSGTKHKWIILNFKLTIPAWYIVRTFVVVHTC